MFCSGFLNVSLNLAVSCEYIAAYISWVRESQTQGWESTGVMRAFWWIMNFQNIQACGFLYPVFDSGKTKFEEVFSCV
jgi:hypothetical protein